MSTICKFWYSDFNCGLSRLGAIYNSVLIALMRAYRASLLSVATKEPTCNNEAIELTTDSKDELSTLLDTVKILLYEPTFILESSCCSKLNTANESVNFLIV